MAELVQIRKPDPLPADFAGILRDLADRIEKGEVASFVGAYQADDRWQYLWPSSLSVSLMLASMLQHRAAARLGLGNP